MSCIGPEERGYLLRLARHRMLTELGGKPELIPAISEAPGDSSGCFVTLSDRQFSKPHGLRGCIGTFQTNRRDLLVDEMAAAVLNDGRFTERPVTLEELPRLHIEISLLGALRPLQNPLDFQLGEEGIEVIGQGRYAGQRGVYLPQVATEHHLDQVAFLNSCCGSKAGMRADAWRDPKCCLVMAFECEILREADGDPS